ncbi:hypothetical protein DFH08DRAFT_809066 [Mycena albidolilacea]|uniref:Uncharacterized protein n=1 Tax=Mycena albidolilacea TaxID=1033008 RepID=A0AAD7ES20_9AGAR|nr:hypothetical protein DFH08DRAFT_809066 [Mycena albidolilacea]
MREPVPRPVKKKKGRLRMVQSTEREFQSDGSSSDSEHKFGLRRGAAFMVQQCIQKVRLGNKPPIRDAVTEATRDKRVRSLQVLFVAEGTKNSSEKAIDRKASLLRKQRNQRSGKKASGEYQMVHSTYDIAE